MKKIMFILPRMNNGGAERIVSILANAFVKRSFQVVIAVLVGENSFYHLSDHVKYITANILIDRSGVIRRKLSLGLNFGKALRFVKRTIKEQNPNVVIPLLPECEILTYLATYKKQNIVKVVSDRCDPTQRNVVVRKVCGFIYKRADLLICQSKVIADYYVDVQETKKCVIPNLIDKDMLPVPVNESKPLRIVSVGRLVPQKNMSLLIDAFSLISDLFEDVTLTIYGEGPQRGMLERSIKQSNLQNRVFLPGASQDIFNQIKDAAVFVMPSNYEGFPNALLEAMALKIPVISTDFRTGVAREIVTKDRGLVVPCHDKQALATAMKQMIENDDLRRRIRRGNRDWLEKYSVSSVVKMWEDAISRVIR